jgi:hypothetical protein
MRNILILLLIITPLTLSTGSSAGNAEPEPAHHPAKDEAPAVAPAVPYPATTRSEASAAAKRSAGRADPLEPITGFKPFPSNAPPKKALKESLKSEPIPSHSAVPSNNKLVPPPPPMPTEDELPVSALPLPPDRPSLSNKLKLTAIIGDKGVFMINDFQSRQVNKWPKYLIMAPGDRFESIELVSVGTDSVVLREDGERSVKSLERIR